MTVEQHKEYGWLTSSTFKDAWALALAGGNFGLGACKITLLGFLFMPASQFVALTVYGCRLAGEMKERHATRDGIHAFVLRKGHKQPGN